MRNIGADEAPPEPAASPAPLADTPAIKVGVLLFADYTVQQQPKIKDAPDGNDVTLSQFQIGRSYINVTGNISTASRRRNRRSGRSRSTRL